MGAIIGIETITCRHCGASYLATFKIGHAPADSFACIVCGQVAFTWSGDRSYSDFRLVHQPTKWKPSQT